MNIKKIVIKIFFIYELFLVGCAKNKNENLAHNYYQLALLELEDDTNKDFSYRKALAYTQKALENSDNHVYKSFKASLLLLLGEQKEALEIHKTLMDSNLDSTTLADVKNNYACALAQVGNLDNALKIWTDLTIDKSYLTPEVAFLNKAKGLALKKDYQASKAALCEAIAKDQSYEDAHFNLALVSFYYLNDLSLAKEAIAKAVFLDPENVRIKQFYDVIIDKHCLA